MIERKVSPESERLFTVPLYKQADPRWGDIDFDDPKWTEKFNTTIASSGCGPSVLAMGVSNYRGREIFPPEMAKKVVENGWRALAWNERKQKLEPDGTHADAIIGIPKKYEVPSKETNFEEADKAIDQGKLVIQLQGPGNIGSDGKGDGYFTSYGHYILLTGKEGDLYKVHDPGPRDITHATKEQIIRDLKKCWVLG